MQTLSQTHCGESLQLIQDHNPCPGSERDTLHRLWQSGRLRRHLDSLEHFFYSQKPGFYELQAEQSETLSLIELAKLFVIQNVIVDRISETFDQLKEIESEIWIQGEQGNFDRDRIACEWASSHARIWRQWRLKEYLYVIEQMESQLRRCLAIESGPYDPQS